MKISMRPHKSCSMSAPWYSEKRLLI